MINKSGNNIEMETYRKVESVTEAQRTLATAEGTASVIAGGQEVMLDLRHGSIDPGILVDISEIEALNEITRESGGVSIGACVTYRQLASNSDIRESFPSLVTAVEEIAGPPVRNHGTLGGAICDADPVFDAPAVLLALDATVTVDGPDSTKTVPLAEFYTADGGTVLSTPELLTSISLPELPPQSTTTYRSMTPRAGDATVAGVAVSLTFDTDTCTTARLALTNAGPTPVRSRGVESVLEGTAVEDAHVSEAVKTLSAELDLCESETTSRSYREAVFPRLAQQAIRAARGGDR
jgi:carbon-monoxide dehydrogenase medium subunit